MGLDNGLILYTKNPVENIPQEIAARLNEQFNGNEYEYTICYWRKCYNIRNCVRTTFHRSYDDLTMDNLCVSDVKQIWNIIHTLNKKKRWEEGDSIWSYKEMRDVLDHDLLCIEWLIYYMRHHNDDEYRVEFYDSV